MSPVNGLAYHYFHTGELVLEEEGQNFLPDVESRMVKFKACPDNKEYIFLGNDRVSEPDEVTDCDCGWPLAKGEETDWIPIMNLKKFSIWCRRPGDRVFYKLVK